MEIDPVGYMNALQNQIDQNNSWSAEQVQRQMDFQERMSNTAHQREIADLKAAGLNPVLSARLGGASTPSGASAVADPSGTSAMASVLVKVLDIEADNAKANLVRAAAQSSSGSGLSMNNSGKGLNATDVQGALNLVGLPIPTSAADLVASVYNGIFGFDDSKTKSTIGSKVAKLIDEAKENTGRSKGVGNTSSIAQNYRDAFEKKYNTTYEPNNKTVSGFVSSVSSAIKKGLAKIK